MEMIYKHFVVNSIMGDNQWNMSSKDVYLDRNVDPGREGGQLPPIKNSRGEYIILPPPPRVSSLK